MLKQLAYTSALAGSLSLALIPQAQAVDYVISNASTTQITFGAGPDSLTVTSTGSITNSGGVLDLRTGTHNFITNNGTINGQGSTALTVGSNAVLNGNITNTGTITGAYGIQTTATGFNLNGNIVNSGTISGTNTGISLYTETTGETIGSITNSGTISGGSGNALDLQKAIYDKVNNQQGGVISSTSANGLYLGQYGSVTNGIQNAGTIRGAASGIRLMSSAAIHGGITNSGTIQGTDGGGTGINLSSSASVTGGLNNSGTISGNTRGIEIDSGTHITGGLTNSNLISGGTDGVHIYTNGTIVDTIVNSGRITGTTGTGLYLDAGGNVSGVINNSGTISGVNGISLYTSSSIGGGITNTGTISGSNYGITVNTGSSITGNITNSGTIQGTSTAGIYIYNSNITGDFTNSGSITGAKGIYVNNPGTWNGNITNNGSIIATGTAVDVGNTYNITGSLTNTGTIRGSTGISVITSGGISSGITNSGTIEGTGGTAIYIRSPFSPIDITLNGGRVIGNIVDANPTNNGTPTTVSGDFTTEGNITVSSLTVNSGKNLTISSGNTVTLDHMAASTGGTFTFGVNNSSAGGYGKLVTSGAGQGLTLTGSTIAVNYTGGLLHDGDQFRIGQGNAAITGGPGASLTSVTDNSILWDFKIANGTVASTPTTNSDLFLFVTRNNNISYSTIANQNASQTLLSIGSSSDSSFSSVISSVNSAPTIAALNQRASATLPPVDGASYLIAQSSSATSFNQAGNRLTTLASNGSSGIAAGDAPQGRHVWMEGFGNTATQGMRSGIAGYTASTGGVTLGADTDKLHPDAVVGVSIGFANTDARADNANATKTQISSNRITLYGGYDLGQNYFARGMAAYAYDSVDTTRFAVGGVGGINADGSYHANQYAARAELGRDFTVSGITVTPALRTNYLYYDASSYTETGAGGASLHVSQKGLQTLEAGPTINVKKDYALEDGSKLTPELRAGYQYAVINDDISSLASFTGGGGTITAPGATPADSRYSTGFGVTYTASDTWKFKADVDYQYRSDFHATSGILRASYSF